MDWHDKDLVWTWHGIADAMKVGERSARRWAMRNFDPLPVYMHQTRGVFASRAALLEWDKRRALPFSMAITSRKRGRAAL